MIYTIKDQSTVWMLLAIWKRDINCNVGRFVFKRIFVNGVSIMGSAFAVYDDQRQKYIPCLSKSWLISWVASLQ